LDDTRFTRPGWRSRGPQEDMEATEPTHESGWVFCPHESVCGPNGGHVVYMRLAGFVVHMRPAGVVHEEVTMST
jgi:hypothetical protein